MAMNTQLAALAAVNVNISTACLLLGELLETKESNDESKKRKWVNKWRESRDPNGNIKLLFKELNTENDFRGCLHMDESSFEALLTHIKDKITKQDTHLRKAVSAEEKLAVTLRYLATGNSLRGMETNSKLSTAFICHAVNDVVNAICNVMQSEYMRFPSDKGEWVAIASDFAIISQFPVAIGALDADHLAIRASHSEAPLFRNSRGFHSVVLLALADAKSRFLFVDIGSEGRLTNSELLQRSKLMSFLQNSERYLPESHILGKAGLLPYTVLGDNTFPLLKNLMTPYSTTNMTSERLLFNQQLNSGLEPVYSAFKVLKTRFRILQSSLSQKPEKLKKIIFACCILHNFLKAHSTGYAEDAPAAKRRNILVAKSDEQQSSTKRFLSNANMIRESWTQYFLKESVTQM